MDSSEKIAALLTVIGVALLCCLGCGGCFIGNQVEYADGFRDGTIVKLSERGAFFKTFEGEMMVGGVAMKDTKDSGMVATPVQWEFSAPDPAIRQQLESWPSGKRVRLHYKQRLSAWNPRGSTSYYVVKVEECPN